MPWLAELRRSNVQVVSCFASVTAFKGIHHFLSAAAALNARGYRDKVVFLSVGDVPTHDTPYYDWLNERRAALNIDNFTFAGVQQDPFAFYRETDITVLPSVGSEVVEMGKGRTTLRLRGTEGLPRTHLEAMSFAIPTVGTDLAGVTEQIVDGVTGFVVPPSDPVALTDRLDRLLRDPALRKKMGLAGRQRIFEKFTTDQYVAGVVRVYEELLQLRGA
jgi:glycosyltransferase involved in cell wall biosynthesis